MTLNKSFYFKLLIFGILIILLSKHSIADDIFNKDGSTINGAWFGTAITAVLTKPINLVNSAVSPLMSNNQNMIPTIFKLLFIIEAAYTLSKIYLEGNYQSIFSTMVTRCFFGAVFLTFVGPNHYYFSIPTEIVKFAMGGTASTWSVSNIGTAATGLITGIFKPWVDHVTGPAAAMSQAFNTSSGLAASIGAFMVIFAGSIAIWIGYFLLVIIAFTMILKFIEMAIGIAICVFLLALKGSSATGSYFDKAMKYIVTVAFDLGIIALVSKLGTELLTSAHYDKQPVMSLFAGLFALIIWMALWKVSGKIGKGISTGSPQVTMSDASSVIQSAVQVGGAVAAVGSLAAMGAGIVGGAAAGAVGGAAAGAKAGGIGAAIKGAVSGVASGGAKGFSMAKTATSKAGSKAGGAAAGASGNAMTGKF